MTVATFDTLALVKKLRDSGFGQTQAEALTEAFNATQQAHLEALATKRDLKELEIQFRREMAELKADLIKWLFGIAAGQIALIVALLKLIP